MKENTLKELKNICVLSFDKVDGNGRIYSQNCIDINTPELVEKLVTKTFFGRINPSNAEPIDITKVAFSVEQVYKKEDGLYVDIVILDTPEGRKLLSYYDENHFRTTCVCDESHYDEDTFVVDKCELISVDYVTYPA